MELSSKFKSIPVFNSTQLWLTENYNKLKEVNFVTKCTCDLAETTIKNSFYLASPIVTKLKFVNLIDHIACNQLEKLEAAFPIIKSDPDTLINNSKELINKTVQPAVTCYATLKTNTEVKYNFVKNYYEKSIESILDMSQSLIESYLISEQDLTNPDIQKVDNYIRFYLKYRETLSEKKVSFKILLKHIGVMTFMLFYSSKAKLVKQKDTLIQLLKIFVSKLFQLANSNGSLRNKLILKIEDQFNLTKDKIDLYKEYLDVLCKQFTVQDGRSLHHVQSLEERTKIIIRRTIGNIIIAFHIIYSRVNNILPFVNFKINLIRQCFSDLYRVYNKNDGSFNDLLIDNIVKELKELRFKTQFSVHLLIKNLNNSQIVNWFVPNFDSFGILTCENDDYEEKIDPNSRSSANTNISQLTCTTLNGSNFTGSNSPSKLMVY